VRTWITYAEAAEILGCHYSNVPKLIRKGHLTSRGRVGDGALDRSEVEALAERRRLASENFAPKPKPDRKRVELRPDSDHDWLSPREVAQLVGITPQAVIKRIHRERLPATEKDGRWWVRRDLLEQVEAARLAGKTRLP